MDSKIKIDWIVALRSGKFKQIRGLLVHGTANKVYCCLGVLCEVQGIDWDKEVKGSRMTSKVPEAYAAGLTENELVNLASKNDNYMSFERIADYIEQTIPG